MPISSFSRPLTFLICIWTIAAAHGQALELQEVATDVYAIVGPLDNRSANNLGNNATFGFVVTTEGVVLIDSGGSYQGAAEIEHIVKSVTDFPVKIVINSGGQDHRWLGNGYFKDQGATIVASNAAVEDQRERSQDQLLALIETVGAQQMARTEPVFADQTFDQNHAFNLGGIDFELQLLGPAHTPGDSVLWLPENRVLFSGDIVYVERMLGVGPQSSSRQWLEAFERIAALEPTIIVPGHGPATSLEKATADTYDYLVFLRQAVADFVDAGGGIEEIAKIDQSEFAHLRNFESLKGRNAQQVFDELEWE